MFCATIVFSDIMERNFSAVVSKGKVAFVAFCPELGVTSQGETEKKACENLKEAIELYLEDDDVKDALKETNSSKPKICNIAVSMN